MLRAADADPAILSRILEVVPGGIVRVGPDGQVLNANRQAQEFLGMSWDALGQRYVLDFAPDTYNEDGSLCPVEDYPVSRCLMTGEEQPPRSVGVRQPSGEVRWAIFTALPFPTPEGVGAVVTFVDITERRRSELRARAHTRILDAARMVQHDGNLAAPSRVLDEPLRALVELTESRSGFVAAADGEAPLTGELSVLAHLEAEAESAATTYASKVALDAISRAALEARRALVSPEHDEGGPAVTFPLFAGPAPIGVVRLAGARAGYPVASLAETGLLVEACGDLVNQLAARSARARLSAQLAQAERLASVGTLAAGMAHEVNNPLAYVMLNVEALARDSERLLTVVDRVRGELGAQLGEDEAARLLSGLDRERLEALREHSRNASDGAERVRNIVRDLMTFSRVSEQSEHPVDVNAAVDVALKMADHEIKYRARLTRELSDLRPVRGQDGRLSQVFLNLLLNAARAIDEGRPEQNEIRVRSWTSGDEVFVEVRDTGRGIEEAHLPRLFEPFFSTRAAGAGAGLGLSICHNLVTEIGGRIEVESEVGVGTRFVVVLPATTARAASLRPRAEPAPSAAPVGTLRLLLVDDEPLVRRVLGQLLARLYHVTPADGVASAIRALSDGTFDVVVCDMMMLDGTGVDVHAWIDAHRPDLEKRLIFMTGGAFTPLARAFLAERDAPHLLKPFTIAQLEEAVRVVVG